MSESAAPWIFGYQYVRELAPGGYSMVYLYRQESPEREVAVKVLADRGLGAEVLGQLAAEANVMARFDTHPNVVPVLATGQSGDGRHYIVMPYCSGDNLLVRSRKYQLDVRRVVRVGVQIATAVQAAHRAGIVHRDIKPANILTDQWGTARLTDFGIAGRLAHSAKPEAFGLSLPWAPPEILDGAQATAASDVYSLGATLWQLLVGRSPFEQSDHNTAEDLEGRIRHTKAPRTGRDDVPKDLEDLIASMLARKVIKRPGSAEAVLKELERIEKNLGGPLPVEAPWERQGGPIGQSTSRSDWEATRLKQPSNAEPVPEEETAKRSRPGWRTLAVAIAVIAVVVAGVVVYIGQTPQDRPTATEVNDTGPGSQDAGALGDSVPPGVPAVTATRTDATTVRFSWKYSAPLATDTFQWRTVDGAKSDVARSPFVDLPAAAGTEICLQVKVIRADGSHAAVEWSPKGCTQ